jgi:hypothetical protein
MAIGSNIGQTVNWITKEVIITENEMVGGNVIG